MKKTKSPRPRTTICWYCGRKLRAKKGGGFSFAEAWMDGHYRIVHKVCEVDYNEECISMKNWLGAPGQ